MDNDSKLIRIIMRERNKSIDLPLEMQFGENRKWEESFQRYQLDQDFQEKSYFAEMDADEFLHLIRKLDNFLMERGVSEYFIRNYALANQVYEERFGKEEEASDCYSY